MTEPRQLYRIHWVAEQTGVPEATLRAWERRYSVPTPARTPSGYRVYSKQDVDAVKRMRELCDSGMSASEAAQVIAQPQAAVPSSAHIDSLGAALSFMETVVVERISTVVDRRLRCVGCAQAKLEGSHRAGAPLKVTIALQHVDPERVVVQAVLCEDRAEELRIASAEFTLGRV
ncbi:MAG TPA: MerR family transcriptional regulator [Polyangiales bacterium]|nr:MerR family transcriptional regulator [Polyangiales bacterium]